MRKSSYCFQRVLAITILSVHLSVTRVDQSKTVQARITKFSPSAAWKTLITNRKSYTGSLLPPNSMTLNAEIGGFHRFFCDSGLRDAFQEWTVLKSIETDMDKLHMKFSALIVDFDGPSLDFPVSRKPQHEGIKERYPCKSRYFTVVGQSFVKTVAYRHGHAAYHNKH